MKPWEELKDAFLQSRRPTLTLVNRYAVKQFSFIVFNLLLNQVSPDETRKLSKQTWLGGGSRV